MTWRLQSTSIAAVSVSGIFLILLLSYKQYSHWSFNKLNPVCSLERIAAVCERNSIAAVWKPIKKRFLYSPAYNVAYCKHCKAGTSTWSSFFMRLSNLSSSALADFDSNHSKLHKDSRTVFGVTDEKDFDRVISDKAVFKFTFVRHPLERLVSAYEDRVLNVRPTYEWLPKAIKDNFGDISFQSFIRYVVQDIQINCSPVILRRKNAECRADVHWRPFHTECGYCHLKYDLVGRMESFGEAAEAVVAAVASKDEAMAARLEAALAQPKNGRDCQSRDARAKQYYKDISDQLRMRLIRIYDIDFQMFGYDPRKYF